MLKSASRYLSLSGTLGVASTSSLGLHTTGVARWNEYDNKEFIDEGEDGMRRLKYMMNFDWRRYRRRYEDAKWDAYKRKKFSKVMNEPQRYELIPYHSDFLIIGGGIMGSSIAFWLKQRYRDEGMLITVVECDDTLSKSSSILSLGGFHTQFSCPENVALSLFSAEFLRNAGEHLRILDSEPPDISFLPIGHMFLATNEVAAKELEEDWKMGAKQGAKVDFLNADALRQRFPFICFDDVIAGTIGLENEGAIEPWQLLSAIREKNIYNGVQYVKGRVEKFIFERKYAQEVPDSMGSLENIYDYRDLGGVVVRPQKSDASPRPLRFYKCVNAAGAWAGEIASLTGIGHGKNLLSIPIPIEKRKRCVFVVHCPEGPGLDMPYLHDPSGVWVRREGTGSLYYVGKDLTQEEDADTDHSNLDVDYDLFYTRIWPILAARVPAFKDLKVKNAWAGYVDMNYWDGAPIVGFHPAWWNMFHIGGFPGRGIQHSMGLGRAVMELFLDGAYREINLRKYSPERMLARLKLDDESKATYRQA